MLRSEMSNHEEMAVSCRLAQSAAGSSSQSALGSDFYALERERRLVMECCRLQQELAQTQSVLSSVEKQRDALSQQVLSLHAELGSRSALTSSSDQSVAELEASNRQLLQKLQTQEQFWADKVEDLLLRAAVDLNRQGRELRKQLGGDGAGAGKPRLETPRSSAASSPTMGEPIALTYPRRAGSCGTPSKRTSESGSEIAAEVAGMSMDKPNMYLRRCASSSEAMKKRKNPVSPQSLLISENVINCGSACDTIQRTFSAMSDNSYHNTSDISEGPPKKEHYVQTSPAAQEEEAPGAGSLGPHALLAHIKSFARRRTK